MEDEEKIEKVRHNCRVFQQGKKHGIEITESKWRAKLENLKERLLEFREGNHHYLRIGAIILINEIDNIGKDRDL